jgi:hypothetical protein
MSCSVTREECLAAVLDDVVAAIQGEIVAAGIERLGWRERVRRGLWTILGFFDREPALARVCVVQALRGGPVLLQLLRRLASLGLLANAGPGHLKGEPNAWTLTAKGEQVARSIRLHSGVPHQRRAA